jgi:hypothetical protein
MMQLVKSPSSSCGAMGRHVRTTRSCTSTGLAATSNAPLARPALRNVSQLRQVTCGGHACPDITLRTRREEAKNRTAAALTA